MQNKITDILKQNAEEEENDFINPEQIDDLHQHYTVNHPIQNEVDLLMFEHRDNYNL